MKPSLRDKLERVLAENRALVSGLDLTGPLVGQPIASQACNPNQDNKASVLTLKVPIVTGSEDSIAWISPHFSSAPLNRLNDSLRGSGISPLSTDSEANDVILQCASAVDELTRRNEKLINRLALRSAVERPKQIPLASNTLDPVVQQTSAEGVDPELGELRSELERSRKVCKSQSNRIRSLEIQLRKRGEELEKRNSLISEQAKKEDRASAVAMVSLREHKLGTSGFLLANNYQKQIENLQDENAQLRRKFETMSAKLRRFTEEDDKSERPTRDFEAMQKEIYDLNDATHSLTRELEGKDDTIRELKSSLRAKELALFELREEVHFRSKQSRRNLSTPELVELDVRRALVTDLMSLTCSKDVDDLRTKVSITFTQQLPALHAFVESVSGQHEDDICDEEFLIALSKRITHAMNEYEELVSELKRVSVHGEDAKSKVRTLAHVAMNQEDDSDPDIKSLMAILGLQDRSALVRTVQTMQFKFEELTNFFNTVVGILRLRKGCSTTECARQISKLLMDPSNTKTMAI
jgi:hypothetical protein